MVEVDGSTVEAAWKPLAEVLDGTVPTVALVTEVLEQHRPFRLQRVAAYGWWSATGRCCWCATRPAGPTRAAGRCRAGGIDHGESPRQALVREMGEETGLDCTVGDVLESTDAHFEGTAPSGRAGGLPHRADRLRGEVLGDAALGSSSRAAPPTTAAWVELADLDGRRTVRPNVRAAPWRRGSGGRPRERDGLHLRRAGPEVRQRRLGRGRPRPGGVRRPAGAAGHRRRGRGDRSPRADRRPVPGPRARRRGLRRRPGRAHRRVDGRRDRVRQGRPVAPGTPSTRCWPSAAVRRSTPPRRSTCCSPTPAS